MKREQAMSLIAAGVTVLAVGLMVVSWGRSHPVFAKDDTGAEAEVFTNLTERAMVIETTYSGVTRDEGKIRYTWTPGEAGTPACPT